MYYCTCNKLFNNYRENKLEDKIVLVKGRLEDTQLPIDKVDIIVSEWMGYFLLFEAMVDSVIYARDIHLKPDGIILPNRCTISLVGCCDKGKMYKRIFTITSLPLQSVFCTDYIRSYHFLQVICLILLECCSNLVSSVYSFLE